MPTSTPGEEPEPQPARTAGNGRRAPRGPGERGLRLPPVLLALTVVSGIIDAVSFLALGHVFTANMTGNVAVLGFAAAGSSEFSAGRALASLGAFLVGSAAGGWAEQRLARRARRSWLRVAFAAEAALLGAACVIAAVAPGGRATADYVLIAVTAVAMGVRNATVVRLGVADLTTTVLTRTLTGLAADSPLVGGRGGRTGRRLGSVLALLAGAALGGWLVLHRALWVPLLIAAATTATLAPTTSGRP